jgi:FkbM family methyltransferase
MMQMTNIIQKLRDNLLFEKLFFASRRISFNEKILYFFRKYFSLIRRTGNIRYLGNQFFYDNPNTPALLQTYPYEIEIIDKSINLSKVKTVLDIGANIGQWGYTLKTFFPHIKVFSFEPNTHIFSLLQTNSKNFMKWLLFPVGVGKPTNNLLYFTPNASAEGTVIKTKNTKQISVELINLDKRSRLKYNLPDYVDLVKIDVEGAEKDVLNALKDLKYRYLCVEVAIKRSNGIKVEDVLKIIKNSKLLYLDTLSEDAPAGNAIFKVSGNH